ncbi:MAG: serine/threonine protein kinase [Bradymonadaceae bacterium]|nr:serine/threonine protein kinase [Lujinxingiaceae bacterium]
MSEQIPVREAGVFLPGDVIERKYRILRLLAEGGMGSVYHAIQEPLGRDVALKVLKPGNDTAEQRDQRHKRFFREASLSSRLSHPNTVMIFDYGELEDKQGFFLVMEYLEGRQLRDLMPDGVGLDPRLAMHLAMQIAGSLAEAHEMGVVHRDLKPPNIMLVNRGGDPNFVKVVDFGLVKELGDEEDDELTAENTLLGSPTYMAPERFLSKASDSPSVDVYALGIMLYEMLAGRPPFKREADGTVHQLIMQHIQVAPSPLRTFRPTLVLPDGLEALIMRCLAKHPEQRIGSMEALLRLLKSCAGGMDGFSTNGSLELAALLTPGENSAAISPGPDTGPGHQNETNDTVANVLPQSMPSQAARPVTGSSTAFVPEASLQDATQADATRSLNPAAKGRVVVAGALTLGALLAALLVYVVISMDAKPGTPTKTELFAQSVPSGAVVHLGAQELGRTPLRITLALPPRANLRFSLEGFEDYGYIVSSGPSETLNVRAQLAPLELAEEPATVLAEDAEKDKAGEDKAAQAAAALAAEAAQAAQATKTDTRKTKSVSTKQDTRKQPDGESKTRPADLDIKLDR